MLLAVFDFEGTGFHDFGNDDSKHPRVDLKSGLGSGNPSDLLSCTLCFNSDWIGV